jgi:hypothetical protein
MKCMKIGILPLAVVVGGAVVGSAADKVTVASTSDVAVTNVVPLLWVGVSTIPSSYFVNPSNVSPASIIIVDTDGSGKISGVVNLIKTWTTGGTRHQPVLTNAVSSWIGSVKGKVTASQMGYPTIQMTIQAQGYSAPATGVLVINSQQYSAVPSKVKIQFKSTAPAIPVVPNPGPSDFVVEGSNKINFNPGTTTDYCECNTFYEPAELYVEQNIAKEIGFRVIVYGHKVDVIAQDTTNRDIGGLSGAGGQGSVNSQGAFSVNLKGLNGNSHLQLKGQLAALAYLTPSDTVTTISAVTEKGKIQGQAVNGQGYFGRFNP